MSNKEIVPTDPKRKAITLAIGGVAGALIGLAGAYLLVQNAERENNPIEISTGEGVKLAVMVFGLLRSIATLHE
jgi:ABC-type uncharacterized transport system permease subunit